MVHRMYKNAYKMYCETALLRLALDCSEMYVADKRFSILFLTNGLHYLFGHRWDFLLSVTVHSDGAAEPRAE